MANGEAGYYNIQHSETVGSEFAFQVYFLQGGGGQLYAGSLTPITFTYPKATWFEVKHLINLGTDKIELFVDNIFLKEWPFSFQSFNTSGECKLGAVDFFAGTNSGETPKFYIDDVFFNT